MKLKEYILYGLMFLGVSFLPSCGDKTTEPNKRVVELKEHSTLEEHVSNNIQPANDVRAYDNNTEKFDINIKQFTRPSSTAQVIDENELHIEQKVNKMFSYVKSYSPFTTVTVDETGDIDTEITSSVRHFLIGDKVVIKTRKGILLKDIKTMKENRLENSEYTLGNNIAIAIKDNKARMVDKKFNPSETLTSKLTSIDSIFFNYYKNVLIIKDKIEGGYNIITYFMDEERRIYLKIKDIDGRILIANDKLVYKTKNNDIIVYDIKYLNDINPSPSRREKLDEYEKKIGSRIKILGKGTDISCSAYGKISYISKNKVIDEDGKILYESNDEIKEHFWLSEKTLIILYKNSKLEVMDLKEKTSKNIGTAMEIIR